jgi:hypothetical protein
MKRNSYKKGPRFGPGACGYLEDVVQQPIVSPAEPVVVVEPIKLEPIVEIEPVVSTEPVAVVETVVEEQPVVKSVTTAADSKSFDKKKK